MLFIKHICLLCFSILCLSYTNKAVSQTLDAQSLAQNLLQQALQNSSQNAPTNNTPIEQNSIKEPQTPKIKDPEEKKENKKTNEQNIRPEKIAIPGTIFINNQDFFSGILYIQDFTLTVTNEYKTKDFIKELPLDQIKDITCVSWYPVIQQDGKTYQFVCNLYNIKDLAGYNFIYKKPIPAINEILFKNDIGTTLFYSYFFDYEDKKQWLNLHIPFKIENISTPLTGVIRTIQFGNLDKNIPKVSDSKRLVISDKIEEKKIEESTKEPKLKNQEHKESNRIEDKSVAIKKEEKIKQKTNSTLSTRTPKKIPKKKITPPIKKKEAPVYEKRQIRSTR